MASTLKNLSDFSSISVPSAAGYTFGIVVSQWNAQVTGALLQGAVSSLVKHDVLESDIHVFSVPGSYELTQGAQELLSTNKLDAVICLGCVIQGETKHFDFICNAVANGLTNLSLKYNKPVIFGVLTTNTLQQAIDRSGGKHGNKGDEAAVTAIQMTYLSKQIKSTLA